MLSDQSTELVFQHFYTGSTKNSVVNVLLAKADAGVTLSPEYDQLSEEERRKLRVLLISGLIPSHPLCAHPRVPAQVKNEVTRGILDMAGTETGGKLLRQVRIPAPEVADYDKDFKVLEGVEVKQLSNWGK